MSKKTIKLSDIPGFRVAAVKAGIKASGNFDLGIIISNKPAASAGVFTLNKVCAAPVKLSKKNLKSTKGYSRAVLVNAGNANACTGKSGMDNAAESASLLAKLGGFSAKEILICSTGVIGHQLPMARMLSGVKKAFASKCKMGAAKFTKAIMTTDLTQKTSSVAVPELGGVKISGVCKGSGMIAPNMATMLGFILTDANISPAPLQKALSEAADSTFNAVTVDGDTSTNDTVLVMASGMANHSAITKSSGPEYSAFADALRKVCLSLAEQIAADGEGATKLVEVVVTGAKSVSDAKKAAKTIAESPLVKTAMFGNDPNWGRILAAAGRSGAAMNENKSRIGLCGVTLFENGAPLDFSAPVVSKKMKSKRIRIEADLGAGKHSYTALTCDFSYDYVKINAEYHT